MQDFFFSITSFNFTVEEIFKKPSSVTICAIETYSPFKLEDI